MLDQQSPPRQDDRVFRFSVSDRFEHWLQMVTFVALAFTGLIQKWPEGWFSRWAFRTIGGIEVSRFLHRAFATILLLGIVYHLYTVGMRVLVRRERRTMLPTWADFKALAQQLLYTLRIRKLPPRQDRFTWDEKLEYWAVVWGTVIMTITGFMLWNPIATVRFLPGQFIPAAKAAHSGEALLAVLAILVWHIYNVHIRHFNKAMFTGYLSRNDMERHHPLELERIDAGSESRAVETRRKVFLPTYGVVASVLLVGIYFFVTFERTAIDTIEPPETVEVFVTAPQPTIPLRPVPTTAAPTTTVPGQVDTWDATIGPLLASSCGGCHGASALGGLDVSTYQSILDGGNSGPAVDPGDPDGSQVVIIQSEGGHPGQLDADQLQRIIDWIADGAAEI